MKAFTTIDEYIKGLPEEHRLRVEEMRTLARKLVPDGEESLSYGMPTIKFRGRNFIHFASMKGHFGFYPTPSVVKAFEKDLIKQGISYSKGCIRFTYDKPLPISLIKNIISFRLKEENK